MQSEELLAINAGAVVFLLFVVCGIALNIALHKLGVHKLSRSYWKFKDAKDSDSETNQDSK